MSYGILIKVTHTGQAGVSIFLSDIDDAVSDLDSFRKPGPIYVPVNQSVCIVYTKNVAISFETGAIRQFVGTGDLLAEFCLGDDFKAAIFPEIQDEGIQVDPSAQIINFTGAGVTATQAAPGEVQVDIPGGGGGDHAALLNLAWLLSGHTGLPGAVAGFDALGATTFYTNVIFTTTPLGGDLNGFLPNPTVVDLTMAGEQKGSILYFDGANWLQLPPGVAGNVLTTNGGGADPSWSPNGTGDVHGPGASTDNALVRWDGATGTIIQNSNVLLSDAGVMTFSATGSIQVNTIDESTANNGVVVNGVRNYGKSATDPAVGPAPNDGDSYYNTTLNLEMRYDGSRSKWLSVEAQEFTFGRNGNTAAGQYYRTVDGRVMSANLGWYVNRKGTVVAMGYTRSDVDAATFEVVATGANITTLASAAIGGGSETLNADFNAGQVLAVRNQLGGNHTSDVVGWIKVKWRA